jgi:hypothetical protein
MPSPFSAGLHARGTIKWNKRTDVRKKWRRVVYYYFLHGVSCTGLTNEIFSVQVKEFGLLQKLVIIFLPALEFAATFLSSSYFSFCVTKSLQQIRKHCDTQQMTKSIPQRCAEGYEREKQNSTAAS